ncbi:MAG: 2-amino-4-hydroxy-6-hydroxymethyldihydropteridine diphosphokinase [Candidatus Fonsibacter sp.]|jgi:2-amino-4-hydroxy-6-hydroxymethyldihydropteridine diphosphokinase|nr:2-amino-4-hydroxy-6-hydroxymethyldihydropteridine diphosphokinase [Candidatus Fonsibacter sp.]
MILLSLGSNLPSKFGDSKNTILKCYEFFNNNDIKILKKSSFYETFAIPNKLDPKFVNSVISVETRFSPEELIKYILKVEEKFDRKREQINAPRTCDIDIVDFNSEIINIFNKNISLEIPHPRLEQRSFVLYPIREIDKNWKSPLSGKKIDQLIENLDAETKKNITII